MCGIFGIIAANPERSPKDWRARTLKRLTTETDIRGKDSTGFAWIAPNGKLRVIKAPEKPTEYVNSEQVKALLTGMPPIVIGHDRNKTLGDPKNNDNNHPIYSDETGIAIIHNGSIRNHMKFRATLSDGTNPFMYRLCKAEVDSEIILRLIETLRYIPRTENGKVDPLQVYNTDVSAWEIGADMKTAIEDAVFNMEGSQACALIHEEEPNVVYLWVTDNPCNLAYVKEYDTIVFASTADILRRSLVDIDPEYEWYYDWFCEEKKGSDKTPEYVINEIAKNTLLRIETHPTDGYIITSSSLKPNAAVHKNYDFIKDDSKFVATKHGVVSN